MIEFKEEIINENLSRIRGLGDVCMYLIKGNKSGLLIDTGYGVGDLKGFVESIYHLPYKVIITHGHADHANGVNQWREVYMNHKDLDVFKIKTDIQLRRTMLRRTTPKIDEIPDKEFHVGFEGKWLELEDNMLFDLGDLHVKTIYAPGHTQGIMTLLIVEKRILILGDACGVATFLFKPESSSVEKFTETLNMLKSHEDEYDIILRQHGTCKSEKSIIDENLEACKLILEGKDEHVPFEYLGEQVWMAHKVDPKTNLRIDGKNGNIVYSMDKIRG